MYLDDLEQLADSSKYNGERCYLQGRFIVSSAEANRATLQPRTKLDAHRASSMRVIVDYPAGYVVPQRGTLVNRDERRPYEVTELRKDHDQLTVFVREILEQ